MGSHFASDKFFFFFGYDGNLANFSIRTVPYGLSSP